METPLPCPETHFTLLSEALAALQLAVETTDMPVFRVWFSGSRAATLNPDLLDENEIMEIVGEMLTDTERFLTVPPSVIALRAAHEKAAGSKNMYLRTALAEQKRRLQAQLAGYYFEKPEKKLKNVERGLEHAEAPLNYLESQERRDYIKDEAARKMERVGRKTKSVDETTEPDSFTDIVKDAAEKVVARFIEMDQRRIDTLIDECMELLMRKIELTGKVRVKKLLEQLLQKTEMELAEAGGPPEKLPLPLVDPQRCMSVTPSRGIEQCRVRKRTLGGVGAPPEPGRQPTRETPPEQNGPIVSTIKKIREMIQLGTGKIRILMPDEDDRISRLTMPLWKKLLSRLGFEGEVASTGYAQLNATSDTKTPIIVSRQMHVHAGHQWNKSRHEHVVIIDISSPRLLMNHLDAQQPVTNGATATRT